MCHGWSSVLAQINLYLSTRRELTIGSYGRGGEFLILQQCARYMTRFDYDCSFASSGAQRM